jgi:hypothetical protein
MGNPLIRMNPTHASTTALKVGGGMKLPGEQLQRGLGGAHFMNPTFIQQGHNTNGRMNTRKTGTYKGKSNKLGHGGRAQQLRDKGVPEGVIGAIARRKGAAPGGPNYHG